MAYQDDDDAAGEFKEEIRSDVKGMGLDVKWRVLDTGEGSAEENMRIDGALLADLGKNAEPVLHLYRWRGKCATYGHFIQPDQWIDLRAAERLGMSLARRPTGGGMIFHMWDYAFSALVPASHPAFSLNTLANYAFINAIVIRVVQEFRGQQCQPALLASEPVPRDRATRHFCMSKPTKYDVMIDGKKVGGAAQRRTNKGYLHQGSISVVRPDASLLGQVLRPSSSAEVLEAMEQNSAYLVEEDVEVEAEGKKFEEIRCAIAELLVSSLTKIEKI